VCGFNRISNDHARGVYRKKTPGGAGTHMGGTSLTRHQEEHVHTDEPHNHPSKPHNTQPATGKKTPEEPGHTRDTHGTRGRTKAHGPHRRTSQVTTIQTHQQHTTRTTHVSATTEAVADSTAAGPEPTAPRGRLRRGRPQRTRPCLHPLPERLPAPAVEGGRRNEGARGRRVAAGSAARAPYQ
jgi:hypothetical protein